jgi:hypothetical protein
MASTPPAPSPIVIDPLIAHKLAGVTLPCGWVLKDKLRKGPAAADETGGNFSVGYLAEKDGNTAFVKVFDLGGALWRNSQNIMKAMMMLGQDHQYECQLLEICRAARLDRIVQVISQGQADVVVVSRPPFPTSSLSTPRKTSGGLYKRRPQSKTLGAYACFTM